MIYFSNKVSGSVYCNPTNLTRIHYFEEVHKIQHPNEEEMKIRRKPKVGGHWSETDVKDPIDLVDEWKPGTTFVLDGTIDKDGTRHSLIGLDISEDDVQALIIKLIEHYKNKITHLEERCQQLEIENDQRKAAFQVLDELIDPYVHPDLFHEKEKDLPRLFHQIFDLVQFGIAENLQDKLIPSSAEEE